MNEHMFSQLVDIQTKVYNLKIALELLPDLDGYDTCLSELCFQVDIPFNPETVKDITEKLNEAGWNETRRYNRDHAGDAVIVFEHPMAEREFSVMLRPDYIGSICKRNIVDYVKQPIYEIVCNEA